MDRRPVQEPIERFHKVLRHIRVTNIGPAGEIALKPGRRTTLLTGDNGLGRTLLLDSAWRTLTGRWPAEANPELRTGFAAFARPDAEQAQNRNRHRRRRRSRRHAHGAMAPERNTSTSPASVCGRWRRSRVG